MERKFKVKTVVLGKKGVGKTSIVEAYIHKPLESKEERKMGISTYTKLASYPDLFSENFSIEWHIWVVRENLQFKEVPSLYYSSARGALLVYDISRQATLHKLSNYVEELRDHASCHSSCVILAHKSVLGGTKKEDVTPLEGKRFASKLAKGFDSKIPHIEVSAETGENIEKAFKVLAMLVIGEIIGKELKLSKVL